MFFDRELRSGLLAVCILLSSLALAACTLSHDVWTGSVPAGSGGRGGSTALAGRAGGGTGGRAGAVAAAGGGGRAGTGASGRGGAGGGATGCGMCAGATVAGLFQTPGCCTPDNKCGLDVSSLGLGGCMEQNAAGTLDANCPSATVAGFLTFQGCCRPDGTCGAMDTFLGLGCAANSTPPAQSCKPQ
jgi:hypothetical protein